MGSLLLTVMCTLFSIITGTVFGSLISFGLRIVLE